MAVPWGALIQAGTTILGGVLQSGASEDAKDAQIHAEMQAAQERARATEEARRLQGPAAEAYYTGLNALTNRFGLPTQGVSQATQAARATASSDWSSYGAQNPNVAAEAQRAVGAGEFASVQDYYRWHYDNYGRAEGRPAPGATQQPASGPYSGNANQTDMSSPNAYGGGAPGASPAAGPTGGNALTGTSPGTFGGVENPAYAPQPAYQEPAYQAPSYSAPTYEAPTFDQTYQAPEYQAPDPFSFSIDSFKDNPAFQFAMEQGTGQVLASASATGARQSGAALKALQDRGQKTAYNFYAPERDAAYARYSTDRAFGRATFEKDRDFGYNAFRDARGDFESDRGFGRDTYENDRNFGRDTFENDRGFGRATYMDDRDFGYGRAIDDRNFGRSVYESDRGYLTGRYDRQTDDMFRYTGMTSGAPTVITNAALGQASDNAAGMVAIGDARGTNALTQGNLWAGVAGNLGGLGSSYLQNRGGSNQMLNGYLQGAASQNPYLF